MNITNPSKIFKHLSQFQLSQGAVLVVIVW